MKNLFNQGFLVLRLSEFRLPFPKNWFNIYNEAPAYGSYDYLNSISLVENHESRKLFHFYKNMFHVYQSLIFVTERVLYAFVLIKGLLLFGLWSRLPKEIAVYICYKQTSLISTFSSIFVQSDFHKCYEQITDGTGFNVLINIKYAGTMTLNF